MILVLYVTKVCVLNQYCFVQPGLLSLKHKKHIFNGGTSAIMKKREALGIRDSSVPLKTFHKSVCLLPLKHETRVWINDINEYISNAPNVSESSTQNPMTSFPRWQNRGLESLNNLPKSIKPINGRIKFCIQAVWL